MFHHTELVVMFEPFTVVIEVLELFDAALVTSKVYVTVVKFTTCCAMLSKAGLGARMLMSINSLIVCRI